MIKTNTLTPLPNNAVNWTAYTLRVSAASYLGRWATGMRVPRLFTKFLITLLGCTGTATVAAQEAVKRSACEAVISMAKAHKLVHEISGEYHCESVEEFSDSAYFIVNLKYWSRRVPKDFYGSNLVGWFAVKKSDLTVYEVNIADDILGRPLETSRKRRKPNKAFRRTPSAPLN